VRPLTPLELIETVEASNSLLQQTVDLWLLTVSGDDDRIVPCFEVLSSTEKERAARFRFDEDRARCIVARGALRWIASSYCGVPPTELEFETGAHGKPKLQGETPALEFNVSHSGEFVLIGIAPLPCGVDIERIRPGLREQEIAERFFCPQEVQWLSRTQMGFARLWTAKEAIIKALGGGLSIPLSSVDVTSIVRGESSFLNVQWSEGEPARLWVNELVAPMGYAASVALSCSPEEPGTGSTNPEMRTRLRP